MALYTIKSETLTALGDAVREKTGALTKPGYIDTETWKVEVSKGLMKSYYFPADTRSAKIEKVSYNGHVVTTIHDSNGQELKDENGNSYGNNFYLEEVTEIYIEDMDVYQFKIYHNGAWLNTTFVGEFKITSYDADGNIIQVPGEVKNTMTPAEMAEAIEGLPPTPPEEAFTITGSAYYKFNAGGWDWFINLYGDKVKTSNLTDVSMMFKDSKVKKIPFDINTDTSKSYIVMASIFQGCSNLEEAPKVIGKPDSSNDFFAGCNRLREIPEEAIAGLDWSYVEARTSAYSSARDSTFEDCYSLRKFPMSFLAHGNPIAAYSSSIYYYGFSGCYALDEIVGLPIQHRNAKWTSNAFVNTFNSCHRLKRLTFETNEDGTPIKINTWSKQTIDLSRYVGYVNGTYFTNYIDYHGIGNGTLITDDATYQALKDNEDSWTKNLDYCRYNKTSAVETINTLPDLSGGAGSNTIKFKGASGALTEGGAINTMTEEEIAVATARGWTVSFA